jgi:nitrous oxidase accessory protein
MPPDAPGPGWRARSLLLAGCALASLMGAPGLASTRRAPPGEAQQVIAQAAAGDTVVLAEGIHGGPVRVDRAIVLRGEPGAVIDGGGRGSVVEVLAPGAEISDVEVRSSGRRMLTVDCGIHVAGAPGVRVARVRMADVLYGIYAERADSLRVVGCELAGRVTPLDERGEGNGIHLWSCGGAALHDNRVSGFLDAVYLSFADRTDVRGNTLTLNGRYGLHTMYCQGNRLIENDFSRNAAGIAIMFSNRLVVERNVVVHNRGPRTYGLLLRDCSDGDFVDNRMVDNTVALFLDGSNRNHFRRNLVQDNGWGMVVFASSAQNVWAENDFIHNDHPVALDMRRTRNRFDDGKRGNYWSDAQTFDLDGDGLGDVPHGPVTAFAFVSKQYPDLAILAKSPAVAALGVAERVFPSLRPSDATDRFPLTRPVGMAAGPAAESRGATRRAWGHAAAFALAWAVGLAGVFRGRRR